MKATAHAVSHVFNDARPADEVLQGLQVGQLPDDAFMYDNQPAIDMQLQRVMLLLQPPSAWVAVTAFATSDSTVHSPT